MRGIKIVAWLLALSLLTAIIPPAHAAAPAAALNKTITISFTATGTAKEPDGRVHGFNTSVVRTVYVSSAGRLFMRHAANSANRQLSTAGGDFGPESSGAGRGGNFSFQGNRLVGVIPYAGGARQITATFDSGFSSCTASVIEGNAGSGSFMRKGPGGVRREITNASTSAVSCAIQNGNAFGGQ